MSLESEIRHAHERWNLDVLVRVGNRSVADVHELGLSGWKSVDAVALSRNH